MHYVLPLILQLLKEPHDMSRIMKEANEEPIKVYHSWGRWSIVKSVHYDSKKGKDIEQYTLQRYSDSKTAGRVNHLCAFFWSIEDLDDFIDELQNAAEIIEDTDKSKVLHRGSENGKES